MKILTITGNTIIVYKELKKNESGVKFCRVIKRLLKNNRISEQIEISVKEIE